MPKKFSRLFSLLLILSLFALLLSACGSRVEKHSKTFYSYFDTVSVITGYDTEERFDSACSIAEDILRDLHDLTDIYHEYSGINNAMTLNLHASEEAVTVDERLFSLLAYGKEIYAETDGLCNIAMGAVLSLWHDCREAALNGGDARLPEDAALREAAEHCNIDDLVLDAEAETVFFADPAMSLDLGALAKGYAAELCAKALSEAGFTGYAISLGGNVRVIGTKPDGSDWVAGVQDPDAESDSAVLRKVSLRDASLVTSGSYQRYFEVDGIRYHHIIDPVTLYPENHLVSVTVLTENSALADALSTALFNMTPEEGLDYVNQRSEIEAYWVLPDGSELCSTGFAEKSERM